MKENSSNQKESKEEILVYPSDVSIPKRKKSNTLLGALFLLAISLVLLWACGIFGSGEDSPAPIAEEGIETPQNQPEEKPAPEVVYLEHEKDAEGRKYEFRAAWLPSVRNLDFPEKPGMSSIELKESFRKILDVYELYNLNAVIMQVRPSADALYLSEINPPSLYVTGDLTKDLPFNLLQFAIEETHKRGMEFHAWFNPFRVTVEKSEEETSEILAALHESNYARMYPSQVLRFDDRLFLDPGNPATREYVINSIMEVVRNYDIDAVHLDDYFYPYRSTKLDENGETVPYLFGDEEEDAMTFLSYKEDFTDIREWRRNNTYTFIKELSRNIHDLKPYVKLGVSPFGIWGHAEETEGTGSDTPVSSSETYHHQVFTDTRKWIQEGLVDYVIPQIYWNFGEDAAPYSVLAKWWNDQVEGTKVDLYIGHANYKVYEQIENPYWQGDTLISDQISYNHSLDHIRGSSFFRFRYLTPSHGDFTGEGKEALVKNNEALRALYEDIAIIPKNENLMDAMAAAPRDVIIRNQILSFSDGYEGFDESEKTRYFLVYQFPKTDLDPENPRYIHRKIPADRSVSRYDLNHLDTENYTYAVSAFNRLHEESQIVLPREE
ncbi:glycoside hydrolase family 10 protein [Proteiniclasticum sp. C24MP]|uniref:glycoside hydrolase family 10 protein n=1 Tax=Proteiniclasticum sp. C24MP TaxID=3374101 RepID=UPI003754DB2E